MTRRDPRRLSTAILLAFVVALALQAHHLGDAAHDHDHDDDHDASGSCSVCLAAKTVADVAPDSVDLPGPAVADRAIAPPSLPLRAAAGAPYRPRGPPAGDSSD